MLALGELANCKEYCDVAPGSRTQGPPRYDDFKLRLTPQPSTKLGRIRTVQSEADLLPGGAMIILMKETATSEQIQRVVNRLEEMGFRVNRSEGVRHTVVGILAAQVDIDICKIAILPGVQSVHRISACVSADAEQPILDRYLSSCGLTMREREVVYLLIEGYSNKEIASRWDITEWTVKDHLKNIYSKLGIHHRTALVVQILRFVSQRNEAQNPEPPIPRGVGPPLIGVNARVRLGSRS